MRFLKTLLLVAALLVPFTAQSAPNAWTRCTGSVPLSGAPDNTGISVGDQVCFEYDENHGTTDVWFEVISPHASLCAILDTQSTVPGDTRLNVRSCPLAVTPSTSVCKDVVITFTAADCIGISRGRYLVNITTPVTAGEDAAVAILGRSD